MTTKTLGDVCKDAWYAYETTPDRTRWQAAAEAVAATVRHADARRRLDESLARAEENMAKADELLAKHQPRADAERAVIEAAKAAHDQAHSLFGMLGQKYPVYDQAVVDAVLNIVTTLCEPVRALAATERGE